MSDFHFLRPLWLLALPAVAFLVVSMLRARRSSRSWATVCDPQLLPYMLDAERAGKRCSSAPWLVGLATSLLIIALAGPTWERIPQPVFRDQSALVIAMDLSRSMNAGDLKPSRLIRARHKITDILRSRQSGQSALLVYAGEAFTVTPLTDDVDTIIAQLPSLDSELMPLQGSRADLAVQAAADLLRQAGVAGGDVLLVTDGIEGEALATPLDSLRKQGHRLSILGAGSREGAPIPLSDGGFLKDAKGSIVVPKLDAAVLRSWAQRGGGRYAVIRADDQDIQYLFAGRTAGGHGRAERADDMRSDQWREQGPWLILLVVPLAALAFRRGVLVLLLVLLIPLPRPAAALDWDSLWSRADQQGMRALREGAAAEAAQRFEDPQWKAAAQYRAGQYEQAAASLESIKTPDALYNRGNALARLGQYPQAISSYQQVLELDPGHQDARHNLELVQQQQQQQQQSQQGSSASPNQAAEGGERQESQPAAGETDGNRNHQADAASDNGAASDEPAPAEAAQRQGAENAANNSDEQQDAAGRQESAAQRLASQIPQAAEGGEDSATDVASLGEQQAEEAPDPAMEQWLRRIPDDPGGLLRRKFLYQYQQRERRAEGEGQPW
jgi:Ca-activated chloride channel family protein